MFGQLAPLTLTLLIVAIIFVLIGWEVLTVIGCIVAALAVLNEALIWLAFGKGDPDGSA